MMDANQNLIDTIKKFFRDTQGHKAIDGDTDLFNEVGLNSIQLVSFIAYLEHLRKQKIDLAEVDNTKIRTINNIIKNYF